MDLVNFLALMFPAAALAVSILLIRIRRRRGAPAVPGFAHQPHRRSAAGDMSRQRTDVAFSHRTYSPTGRKKVRHPTKGISLTRQLTRTVKSVDRGNLFEEHIPNRGPALFKPSPQTSVYVFGGPGTPVSRRSLRHSRQSANCNNPPVSFNDSIRNSARVLKPALMLPDWEAHRNPHDPATTS